MGDQTLKKDQTICAGKHAFLEGVDYVKNPYLKREINLEKGLERIIRQR